MKKIWKNPRLPDCPRDINRRLNPLKSPTVVGNSSTDDSQSVESVESGPYLGRSLSSDSLLEETVSEGDFSESESEIAIDMAAAARPQMKFLSPPTFRGETDSDALDWLHRYETTGSYNKWGDGDLRDNFEMYLDGSARKWFLFSIIPIEWRNLPERVDPENDGRRLEAEMGLRTAFLLEFQQGNVGMFQEAKLRNRVQGINEPTTNYYYDILDLCRVVNQNMSEINKLQYLYRGLKPSLLEKIYPLKLTTCVDFLAAAKVHAEAALMANRRNWSESVLSPSTPSDYSAPIAFVRSEESNNSNHAELLKIVKDLQKVNSKEFKELRESIELLKKQDLKKSVSWERTDSSPRSSRGTPTCFKCEKSGHIARFCFSNQNNSENFKGNFRPPRFDGNQQKTRFRTDEPVLVLDFSKLVTERVMCGAEEVQAIVDTGAAVTVISPALLKKTKFKLMPWTGSKILMANGTAALPEGSADISIGHNKGTATGKAVVMAMDGIELLLGNDFLKQYGKVQIEYKNNSTLLTLGDLPLAAVNPFEDVEDTRPRKLVTCEGAEIPAFSVVQVRTKTAGITEGQMILNPSKKLLATKAISTGHAILVATNNQSTVPVANLSPQPVWLCEGASLGTVDIYKDDEGAELQEINEELEKDGEKIEKIEINPSIIEKMEKQISKEIAEEEKIELTHVLLEYLNCFAADEKELGKCNRAVHSIETGAAAAIHQPPYKNAWKERQLIQDQVDSMLKAKIIEPSDSPWSSPVVLVKKKDGSWRFCVDYRKLNAVTVKDVYPLPRIADTLSRLEGSKYFSIMDLQAGYHQVPLKEEDRPKTAFVTADGLFQFRVLPFGLTNAPSTFQRAMDIILAGIRWTTCLVYLDDIVVYSTTFELHLERLRLVLDCLFKAGLKLKLSKCHFAERSIKMLGHIVNQEGIGPDPEKLSAVKNFPHCVEGKNQKAKVKNVQSFLGLCSYYRRHIAQFAMIARPLTMLTKKDNPFKWGKDEIESFEKLKKALTSAPVLSHPNYDLPMEILTDACGYGIGAVLAQTVDGQEKPVAYASRLLNKSELNYSITEKECLALVWGLVKFRCFVWGCKIKVVTDHQALCWLMSKRDLAGRLARWSLSLQEYDISIVYRSGKLHGNADFLSRYPLKEESFLEEDRCLIGNLTEESESSSDNFLEDQRSLPVWRRVIEKLEAGRAQVKNYSLQNNRLFHRTVRDGKSYLRLCVPVKYRENLLKAYHDDIVSGHMGISRTLTKIRQRYIWPGMANDINAYVQACPSCQGRKGIPDKPAGFLQCIKVERPFEKVGIDLLGPFPISKQGNRMIIVAVDYLTKWVELQAIPTGKADDVSEFFVKQIFLRHGAPEKIITDRGKCFLAELTQSVIKKLNTNHKTTSSYHPQANGAVERMNHTLATMLSMYVGSDHRDWDETLQYVCFAYNTARQESTGFSPFFLLYGREPVLPIDLELQANPNPQVHEDDASMDYAERLMKELKAAKVLVKLRMELAQEKQKRIYNEKRREQEFNPGDLVLIYKPLRKIGKSEKLLHRWLGPYKVVRQTTPVNYEVRQASKSKGKTDIVHVIRMKKFHELMDTPVSVENETVTDTTVENEEDIVMEKETVVTMEKETENTPSENESETSESDPTASSSSHQNAGKNSATTGFKLTEGKNEVRKGVRKRRQPERYVALLPYVLCLLATIVTPISTMMVRDNTLFVEKPDIVFSESSWTIITDLDFGSAEKVTNYLETKIIELNETVARLKVRRNHPMFELAAERIQARTKIFSRDLEYSKLRLQTFREATGSTRKTRGLIDVGGSALKWLFGVSTQADFDELNGKVQKLDHQNEQVVHILELQATVINESLWEIKTNTKMISELNSQYSTLKLAMVKLFNTVMKSNEVNLEYFEYFTHLDSMLDTLGNVFLWLHQFADSFDVGLDMLANGRLAPQIFPPSQLATVLKTLNRKLPLGWTVSSEELWVTYRESVVSVAVINERLRLFIKIPIYDHAQQYKLYEILNLPKSTENGTHGVIIGNLPEFLAVSTDLETFIELSKDDINGCRKLQRQLCNFHTGLGRRNSRKSCAISLFLNDESRKQTQCKQKFIEWKGPGAVYLGQNQWAFSAVGPHDVVFSCPAGANQKTPQPIRLPAIGILDVPTGCTARTEDWVFPASLEGKLEVTVQTATVPSLNVIWLNHTKTSPSVVIELPKGDTSSIDMISELLNRNSLAVASNEMTSKQISNLLQESREIPKQRYPYELLVGLLLSTTLAVYLGWRAWEMDSRMKAHEAHDTELVQPIGHQEEEEIAGV